MSVTIVELRAQRRQELERARMAIIRPVLRDLERHQISAAQVGLLLGLTRVRMHRILTGQTAAPAGFVGRAREAMEQIVVGRAREAMEQIVVERQRAREETE